MRNCQTIPEIRQVRVSPIPPRVTERLHLFGFTSDLPIRFTQHHTRHGRLWAVLTGEPEKRLESRHRRSAPVEAEDKLIEVVGQMFPAHALDARQKRQECARQK